MELLIPLLVSLVWCTTTCQSAPIPMESFHPILGHIGQLPALGLNRSPTVERQATPSGLSSIHKEKYGSFDYHALPVDSNKQHTKPMHNTAASTINHFESSIAQHSSVGQSSSQATHAIESPRYPGTLSAITRQRDAQANEGKGETFKTPGQLGKFFLKRRMQKMNPDWETYSKKEKFTINKLLAPKFKMGSTRRSTVNDRVMKVVTKEWKEKLLSEDPMVVAKAIEEISPHTGYRERW